MTDEVLNKAMEVFAQDYEVSDVDYNVADDTIDID